MMFSQPPEKEPTKSQKHKSARKKRKKQKQKQKHKKNQGCRLIKEANQAKQSLASTMSSWAQNFTMVATWQLKHQVAVWKSRATALEYENQVLRHTLQQFYVNAGTNANSHKPKTSSAEVNNANTQFMDYEESYMDSEPDASDCEHDSDAESSDPQVLKAGSKIEISESYIAYLRQNQEYRRVRDERKMKEANEELMKYNVAIEPQPAIDRIHEFKELYGDSWQQIAALDSYLLSQYMLLCDSEKPEFWPNIPFRF